MHVKRLSTGRRTCLCYQVERLVKDMSKKLHEVMDTRHTIEVNITKASSSYAIATSLKTK